MRINLKIRIVSHSIQAEEARRRGETPLMRLAKRLHPLFPGAKLLARTRLPQLARLVRHEIRGFYRHHMHPRM